MNLFIQTVKVVAAILAVGVIQFIIEWHHLKKFERRNRKN